MRDDGWYVVYSFVGCCDLFAHPTSLPQFSFSRDNSHELSALTYQIITLVFYKLNSAMERGTKPDALGRKPYHWTSTLKAAMVNASRACKYAQPRCLTFFKWASQEQRPENVRLGS